MKRVVLVFVICVGMIVLTNCQDGGGYSRVPYDEWGSLSRDCDERQRDQTVTQLQSRIRALESRVSDLTDRMVFMEARVMAGQEK